MIKRDLSKAIDVVIECAGHEIADPERQGRLFTAAAYGQAPSYFGIFE